MLLSVKREGIVLRRGKDRALINALPGTSRYLGSCPHPLTVYSRGHIEDYIYYEYYPTVDEGGSIQEISLTLQEANSI